MEKKMLIEFNMNGPYELDNETVDLVVSESYYSSPSPVMFYFTHQYERKFGMPSEINFNLPPSNFEISMVR